MSRTTYWYNARVYSITHVGKIIIQRSYEIYVSTSHWYSVDDSRAPVILIGSVPGGVQVPKAEMTEYSRIYKKAEMSEYPRVPGVSKAEMTEYSRVPGAPKAEMTE